MKIVLGENRYGKAENRLVRITRDGDTHHILDLNVTLQLTGDFSDTHITGSNAKVIATDTQKNTIFALSQKHPAMEPEAFGMIVGEHFLTQQAHVSRVEVRLEQFLWKRITVKGQPHPRAFEKDASIKRIARVVLERGVGDKITCYVSSGLEDLVLLKTSDSEFTGFLRDEYTTLPETSDRIMATQVSAKWSHDSHDFSKIKAKDFAKSFTQASEKLMATFADHYSLSLQQTLFEMGKEIITEQPDISAVRLSLPNKHHFLVDLSIFGQKNENEVFFAADRPYGLIEAVITRDDASDAGYNWPAW
ncbi:MAG: urate oxidase [Candidatus Planktophila sp.]|nr:urate oxidase [Candidatus Planktophila sp.]